VQQFFANTRNLFINKHDVSTGVILVSYKFHSSVFIVSLIITNDQNKFFHMTVVSCFRFYRNIAHMKLPI